SVAGPQSQSSRGRPPGAPPDQGEPRVPQPGLFFFAQMEILDFLGLWARRSASRPSSHVSERAPAKPALATFLHSYGLTSRVVRGRVILILFALLLSADVAAAAVRLPGIRSPSGNISCLVVPGSRGPDNLLCKI